jgi:uncharacterized protein (DUF58 family)
VLIPRPTLVLLFVVPALLALLAMGDTSLRPFVWWVNGAILLLMLIDAGLGFRAKLRLLHTAPDVFSLGRNNRVMLELRSHARRTLHLKIRGDGFQYAELKGLPLVASLQPGESCNLEYYVTPRRRGAFALGAHYVRIITPLGLWARQLCFETRHGVRVYPDLQALRAFELTARQDREVGFRRATRLKGGESEFARLREYTRDDEYRAIDWKSTARRQKLIAREYQLESNQNLMFMLDAGRLMTAETNQISYFDYALNACLMLGQMAARNGDRVGLIGFDVKVRAFVPPAGGPGAPRRLIQACYDLHPSLVESDYDRAFAELAVRVRKRCLVILFVQVLDEAVADVLQRRTRALLPRHLPLLVVFRDADIDAMLQTAAVDDAELYAHAAAAELLRWRQGFISDMRGRGALVLDVRPRELTGKLLDRYLEIKARQLL